MNKENILKIIADLVDEEGAIKEKVANEGFESKSGWVEEKSPLRTEEILKKEPEEIWELLKKYKETPETCWVEEERKFIEIGVQGIRKTIKDAIQVDFEWSKKIIEYVKNKKDWKSFELAEAILNGWNASNLSEENWRYVLNFINENKDGDIKECNYSIVELIKYGVSSNDAPIPKNLHPLCLDLLKNTIEIYSSDHNELDDVFDDAKDDWLQEAINSISGIAMEAMLDIITKSKDGWKKETLKENLNKYLLPIIKSDKDNCKKALPIFGRWAFFIFNVNEDWFKENLLPIMKSEGDKAIRLWHGFVYGYECNLAFYKILFDVFTNVFQKEREDFLGKNPNGQILRGYKRLIASFLLRSVLWENAEPKAKKELIEIIKPEFVRGVLSEIRTVIRNEEDVKKHAPAIWEQIIKIILDNNKTEKDYFKIIEPFIETLPYLDGAFEEAVEWFLDIKFSVPKEESSMLHTMIYERMSEEELPKKYPAPSFKLIVHLLKKNYLGIYGSEKQGIISCFKKLSSSEIRKEEILDELKGEIYQEHSNKIILNIIEALENERNVAS